MNSISQLLLQGQIPSRLLLDSGAPVPRFLTQVVVAALDFEELEGYAQGDELLGGVVAARRDGELVVVEVEVEDRHPLGWEGLVLGGQGLDGDPDLPLRLPGALGEPVVALELEPGGEPVVLGPTAGGGAGIPEQDPDALPPLVDDQAGHGPFILDQRPL